MYNLSAVLGTYFACEGVKCSYLDLQYCAKVMEVKCTKKLLFVSGNFHRKIVRTFKEKFEAF